MIWAQASNIKRTDDSDFTVAQFETMYPQFTALVPVQVVQMYVDMANATVSKRRYHSFWKHMVGLFVAHFVTLYLQSAEDQGVDRATILNSAAAAGIVTSESADGVSYSKDAGATLGDLSGWAAWKQTTYGVQFATIAKAHARGGMYIW